MNKVVFITGAVKNSGLAIAKKFASQGYDIALSSRSLESARKTAEYLSETYGVRTKGYELTLRSVEDIKSVFADVKETFGRLDALVTVAAHLGVGHEVLTVTEEQYDDVFDVNAKGCFFCAQQAALIMKEQHQGSIVFIGSVHYKSAIYGRLTYAGSKGAIASMVHNMAFELAEHGIRVNQVLPGAVRTDRWDGITAEEEARRRRNWPMGIESTGEDVAEAVYFLSSDAAKTITGAELAVDSGILSCLLAYNGGKH